ncbi:MAG: adenosylcobinamide-GDP ribazoletransferase [Saccharospirillaceae bacterium]|nr:adenosylcobinamide-GDP ribazoletransferase [Pseudomonadales bacterium]NRB78488.1 adenosylcobinamide-GDP ribazoletransferase [Saccharospirillaceae bacterium]
MNSIKLLLNNCLIAVGFLTRIPIASWVNFDQINLRRSTYYFAFIAWLITLLLVLIYSLFSYIFPPTICIILLIACNVLVTGALHEDGLADFCDAIGVMGSHEQKIKAMKDSRLGSFAVIALIIAITAKFIFLYEQSSVILALLVCISLSRLFAFTFLISRQYIKTQTSKSEQFTAVNPVLFSMILCVCLVPYYFLLDWQQILSLIVLLCVLRIGLLALFKKHIGGVNGDCMGAAQQVSELFILLVLI